MRLCAQYHPFTSYPRKGLLSGTISTQQVWSGLHTTQKSLCFAEVPQTVSFHSRPCSDSPTRTPRCYFRPVVSAGGRWRPAQDPRARQSDLPAPRGGWEWRCWDNVCGLGKPSTRRSWAGVPQQTLRGQGPSVNSPFEQLYFALPKDSKHKLPGGI